MTVLCFAAVTAMGMLTPAQGAPSNDETKRAEVLVLGVYHMANPGHDIFNMHADDVLSPERQKQMAELDAVLAKFKPTKIAVENDSQRKLNERYTQYLAGQYVLTANEIDQIGLRLAREMGHTAIYAVDADGDFPFQRIIDYAKATGQSARLDAMMGEIGEMVKAQGEYLETHTVLQTLLYMNSDAKVAKDVGFYYLQGHYGEPGDYAGPDLLAEWYRRNARIFNNVTRLVTTPEDRILVIFGNGHLGWLRQDFGADPTLRLRKLEDFVPAAAGV
ncbi:MAG TPA: DUF5694 domain-containing protein, partial [Thermoanaerobaculia bacterium]|nr:DUF5694 domain-containing protein [Thermoanaerobaculia bacterium]